MKRILYFLLLIVIISIIIPSCIKEKSYPVAPVITFKEIANKIDTTTSTGGQLIGLDCIISFTDGDGDVGVAANDPIPDLKVVYQYKGTDDKFHPYDISTTTGFDTLSWPYRIPDITPQGQYKALQGDISIQLRQNPFVPPQHSVFRLAIIMRDRGNHYSNWVYTDEITNP